MSNPSDTAHSRACRLRPPLRTQRRQTDSVTMQRDRRKRTRRYRNLHLLFGWVWRRICLERERHAGADAALILREHQHNCRSPGKAGILPRAYCSHPAAPRYSMPSWWVPIGWRKCRFKIRLNRTDGIRRNGRHCIGRLPAIARAPARSRSFDLSRKRNGVHLRVPRLCCAEHLAQRCRMHQQPASPARRRWHS